MKDKLNILAFKKMKEKGEKIVMVTAYDYTGGLLAEQAAVDVILVGDSLGMTMLGYDSTVPVTMDEMVHHMRAVRRGAPKTMCIVDMPYMSYEICVEEAIRNGGRLIKEGFADAVKVEGGISRVPVVEAMVKAGVPVMGHLGLTPQTADQLGGYKVQGRDQETAREMVKDAMALQEAGVFGIVLECVPQGLAQEITAGLSVPTIGIGAGVNCDGQVLVYHDLLGLYQRLKPKFVKQYANLGDQVREALEQYGREVKSGVFPGEEHSF
jgi:3-methyl-2-oxobutanoate hydroxymethyltransferase